MAILPIVSGSEVSTPISGVQMSPQAFRQAALAPGKIAQAVGQDVGGLFQDISQQIQETRNTRKVFDADLSMQKTKAQFLDDIAKDPNLAKDPGTWVPEYQNRVQQTTDSILSQPDLSPVAKRRLQMMTASWGVATTSEVRTQALRREQSDNYASGMAVATLALQNDPTPNGIAKANAAYDLLNQQGLMGPKELAVRKQQAPMIAAEAQANTILTTAGYQAPRLLDENVKGKMPPEKYRVLYRQAQQIAKLDQSQNAQQLSAMMDDDPEHQVPNQAKQWRESGKIDSTQYEGMVNRSKSYAREESTEQNKKEENELNVAMTDASSPPTDEKSLDSWAAEMKNQGLEWTNAAHRRQLNNYVDRQVQNIRKEGKPVESPQVREQLNYMKEDFDQGTSFLGVPGGTRRVAEMPQDKFEEQFGKGAKRQDVIDSARSHYAKTVRQFMDWANDANNKDKVSDPEQVAAERRRLESPSIEAQVNAALLAP